MTDAITLAAYVPLLAAVAVVVWRRPVVALYVFVVGLALHNAVMALAWWAGVRGVSLTALQGWKEALLATAAASVAWSAWRARRLPFRPGLVDALALAFAAVVLVYAALPQRWLGGEADAEARLFALRHALLPVGAFFVGRAVVETRAELRRVAWTIVAAAAAVGALGLVEEYAVSVETWRDADVPGYFDHLGFDYHGPAELPDNWAFNSSEGLFRRLVSVFLSPLASAYMLVVALVLTAAGALRREWALALGGLCFVALLFTLSRSSLLALAGALVLLALARGRWWPAAGAVATIAAGIAFAFAFPSLAPETHFFAADIEWQEERAKREGGLPEGTGFTDPDEPSLRSHWRSLRSGAETVAEQPQGYGLGNAGATAERQGIELKAGESNYTEIGVETGVLGLLLFVAWNVTLAVSLLRRGRVDWAAAAVGASLAAVLALALQTDVYGVPWIGYVLWWLAGSAVTPAATPVTEIRTDRPVNSYS